MKFKSLVFFLWLFVCCVTILSGQRISGFSGSKKEVLVGEPFQVEISISYPDSVQDFTIQYQHALETENELFYKDSVNFEPLADLVLLQNSQWADFSLQQDITLRLDPTQSSKSIQNTCTFAIYNPGIFRLVPPAINGIINDSFSLRIEVIVPEIDSLAKLQDEDIYPIKPIELEPSNWTDYQYWLWALGLLVILYYFYKKYKSPTVNQKEKEGIMPNPSPAEVALQKISLLRQSLADNRLDMPVFHEKISFIIREYLEKHLAIPALELASSETILAFQTLVEREKNQIEKLSRILNYTDLVKFAKSASAQELAYILIEDATDLIMQTKQI